MTIYEWANRWSVPMQAMMELTAVLDPHVYDVSTKGAESEGGVSKRVRLEESRQGNVLWRNNVGACEDAHGNFIRYGLANESKQMNERVKSSDLIGIRRVTITPEMV